MRRWLAALVVAGVAACGGAGAAPVPAEVGVGGVWTVARIGGVTPIPGREPRISFTNGKRTLEVVVPGCSEMTTDVAIDGAAVRVGGLVPVARGSCDPRQRDVERALETALGRASAISGAPGRLVLNGSGGDVLLVSHPRLELTADEQARAQRLRAVPWRLVEADGVIHHPDLPWLRFGEGTLDAAGPCGFVGTVQLRGEDLIHFANLSWEDADACPPAAASSRFDLATLLDGIDRFAFGEAGRQLILSGNGRLARFDPAPD